MATRMNMIKTEQFSIRELSEITGVNAVTLRAWERRYGLLKPQRTAKGHRYYVMADVDKVRNILNWLDRGVAISKVRPLLETGDAQGMSQSVDSHWQETVQRTLALVERFQRDALEQQINELFANYPLDTLVANYFAPLQDALDRQATLRFGGRACKVFFDTELHTDLLARIRHANSNNHGERVLLVALDGREHHPAPLLLALALLEAGFRLHLLLDAISLREIPLVIEQANATHTQTIAAVICHSDSKPEIPIGDGEILRAIEHARLPVFLSGGWLDIAPALRQIDGVHLLGARLRDSVTAVSRAVRGDA